MKKKALLFTGIIRKDIILPEFMWSPKTNTMFLNAKATATVSGMLMTGIFAKTRA
jgi:hypothetical protein